MLDAHGAAFLVEHETERDLPPAWAARESYLLAKRKKRQVDAATIATAHLAQPKLAQTVVAAAPRHPPLFDPTKRCWRCDGVGHISRHCTKPGVFPPPCSWEGPRRKEGKKVSSKSLPPTPSVF